MHVYDYLNPSKLELDIVIPEAEEKLDRIERASKVTHNKKYFEMLVEEQIISNRVSAKTL